MTVLEKMNQAESRQTVWDSGEPQSVSGLHLRTYANGRKCFYLSYTTRMGIRRNPKIGENIGLSEARRRASYLRGQVAIGLDPKGDWDEGKAEKTVAEVFEVVLEKHWGKPRFIESGRQHEAQLLYDANIKKPLGGQKLSAVGPVAVRQWHQAMAHKSTTANRALEVLSKIYSYAIENEWADKNPCSSVAAFTERKRTRKASKEELRHILMSCKEIAVQPDHKDAEAALFVLGLALTGARPVGLREARWDDFTKDQSTGGGVLSFEGKTTAETGDNERVVFPKILVDMLEKIPRREDGLIFGHKNLRGFWDRMTSDFGGQSIWPRDLRRTFASVGLSTGLSLDLIGESLNHKSTATTKTYAKAFDDGRTEVAETVAAKMAEIAELL